MKSAAAGHLAITLLVLAALNALILQKERLLRHGASVLLQLAPVDPRSLIQGDYMQLRYDIASRVPSKGDGNPEAGRLVIRLGEDGVGVFVRYDGGEPLASGEHFLRYRRSTYGQVRFGAESFFFQEGQADRFAKAKYGELKVTPDGDSVLVGLCDEKRRRLGGTAAAGAAVTPAPP